MKIAVIGNAAGGKSTITRKLSKNLDIPATHIDSIQFIPPMQIRPLDQTRAQLKLITDAKPNWIIDGFGPLDMIEQRFALADKIIFIDLPIWQHYLWFFKRQFRILWSPRKELAYGCRETSFSHTAKVVKSMWRMHRQMRPELIKILHRDPIKQKLRWVRSVKDLNSLESNF